MGRWHRGRSFSATDPDREPHTGVPQSVLKVYRTELECLSSMSDV